MGALELEPRRGGQHARSSPARARCTWSRRAPPAARRSCTRVPSLAGRDVDRVHQHAHEPQPVAAFGLRDGRAPGAVIAHAHHDLAPAEPSAHARSIASGPDGPACSIAFAQASPTAMSTSPTSPGVAPAPCNQPAARGAAQQLLGALADRRRERSVGPVDAQREHARCRRGAARPRRASRSDARGSVEVGGRRRRPLCAAPPGGCRCCRRGVRRDRRCTAATVSPGSSTSRSCGICGADGRRAQRRRAGARQGSATAPAAGTCSTGR